MNLLFVCSRNRWRSPTAERMLRGHSEHNARSCGIRKDARVKASPSLLRWADLVLPMQQRHLDMLRARFPEAMRYQDSVVLDIPDDYQFMQPELVERIRLELKTLLDIDV